MEGDFLFRAFRLLIVGLVWQLSVIACLASDDSTPPKSEPQTRDEYRDWVKKFAGPLLDRKPPEGLKVVIMLVEGDDKFRESEDDPFATTGMQFGAMISTKGIVSHFSISAFSIKGSDGETVIPERLQQLDQLLSKLPDDGGRLLVTGRRLMIEVPKADGSVIRVYDRANLPEEVLAIAKVARVLLGIWVPEFKADREIKAREFQHGGFLCLSPDAKKLILTQSNGPIQFWDPITHKSLGEIKKEQWTPLDSIAFSPDDSRAALCGWGECALVDTENWQRIQLHSEPIVEHGVVQLSELYFTPDGKYLTTVTNEASLRIFNTSTWERVGRIPDLPENMMRYFPAGKTKRAIIQTAEGRIVLWDYEQRVAVAELDKDCTLAEAVFSPDETTFATVTQVGWRESRLRLWDSATGKPVRELHVFEKPVCERIFRPLWSPDGQYFFAATKSHPSWTSQSISVWNLKTGKHRGKLVGSPTKVIGVVLLRDTNQLVSGDADGKIRFWDLKAMSEKIAAFEESLQSK